MKNIRETNKGDISSQQLKNSKECQIPSSQRETIALRNGTNMQQRRLCLKDNPI